MKHEQQKKEKKGSYFIIQSEESKEEDQTGEKTKCFRDANMLITYDFQHFLSA